VSHQRGLVVNPSVFSIFVGRRRPFAFANRRGFVSAFVHRAATPMKKHAQIIPAESVASRILTIRGQKVIIDADLAAIYGVTTKRLNEQIKRNEKRFPPDFVFQLTKEETAGLLSQGSHLHTDGQEVAPNRSQFATGSCKHRDPRFLPYAFTDEVRQHEDGVVRLGRAARKISYGELFRAPLGETANKTAR